MWNIQKKIYREERDTVVKGKGEKGTIHPTLVLHDMCRILDTPMLWNENKNTQDSLFIP